MMAKFAVLLDPVNNTEYSTTDAMDLTRTQPSTSSFSSVTNPDDVDTSFSYTERLVISIIVAAISVLGICGNSLVITSFLLSRSMRSATYEFIFNLSCADLLTSLVIPNNIVALLTPGGWPFADWICSASAAILFLSVGCSLFTLASISVERLIVVTRKESVYRKFCSGTFRLWLLATWLIPFCLIVLPTYFNIGEFGYDDMYHSCIQKNDNPNSRIYDLIMCVTITFPLLLMMVSYTIIFVYVRWRSEKALKNLTPSQENLMTPPPLQAQTIAMSTISISMISIATTDSTQDGRPNDLSAHFRRRQILLAKQMCYVFIAFMCCVAPFGIVVGMPNSDAFLPYTASLLLVNGAVNPLIYTRHPKFRRIFTLLIKGQWREIPKPTRLLRLFLNQ